MCFLAHLIVCHVGTRVAPPLQSPVCHLAHLTDPHVDTRGRPSLLSFVIMFRKMSLMSSLLLVSSNLF